MTRINKSIAILQAAKQGGYGVPANVCHSVEQILACVAAAEVKRSPMMLLLFPYSLTWRSSLLVDVAAKACENASVPIALHLDHEQSEEGVKAAASMPFDSIMVDMSHYELDKNLEKTRELTAYCHARGIATEAEPGRINGGEEGVKDTGVLENILTTPEVARRFVETGIDLLAPSFGNMHGADHLTSFQFDYQRLSAVHQEVGDKVQLVLHGTTGDAEVTECIKRGITKVNLNRHVAIWNKSMKSRREFIPVTVTVDDGISVMQEELERLCDLCGSTGKA